MAKRRRQRHLKHRGRENRAGRKRRKMEQAALSRALDGVGTYFDVLGQRPRETPEEALRRRILTSPGESSLCPWYDWLAPMPDGVSDALDAYKNKKRSGGRLQ